MTMETRKQAIGGFKHAKDAELLATSYAILEAMTGNAHFPEPSVPMAEFEGAIKEYEKHAAEALQTQSRLAFAARNSARQQLTAMLKKLAFYVNEVAESTHEKLLTSGFPLSRETSRRQFPGIVDNVRLRDGGYSGCLKLSFSKQKHVPLYEYRYALKAGQETADLEWTEARLSSSTKVTLSGLRPLTVCYAQVRALNGEGRSEWSEPVSFIVR